MDDIANLLLGFSNGLKPETTSDINNQAIQDQLIHQNDINLQYQAEQRKAQIATLAARQKAIQDYINIPLDDPRRSELFNNLMVLAPDLKDSAKQGYDAMTVDAQKQHLNDS